MRQGFGNEQLRHLTAVLLQRRIWALNVGENFQVTLAAWQEFAVRPALGLPYTLNERRRDLPGYAGRLAGVCGAPGAGPSPAPAARPRSPPRVAGTLDGSASAGLTGGASAAAAHLEGSGVELG